MAILKHVGTADCDRERLNMSVKTPASWSTHALQSLPTVLGSGPHQWLCISLEAGKGVKFVSKQDVGISVVAGFPFVVRDCL